MIVFFLALFLSSSGLAQDAIENGFPFPKDLTKGLSDVPELNGKHSLCYEINGNIDGVRIHSPVRLASVSKLVTSYWALKVLGPQHQFVTRVGYNRQEQSLYLDTEGDPFFGERRIFHLLSELNKEGINSVSTVNFFRRSLFIVPVEDRPYRFTELGAGGGPPQKLMREQILPLLNTDSWSADRKERYRNFRVQAGQIGVDVAPEVQFSASKVEWKNNELAFSWISKSPPLIKYLKMLNQYSMNFIGDRVFQIMGGRFALEEFLSADPDLNRDPFEFYTGSGLNIGQGFHRVDNVASCYFMLKLIGKLHSLLEQEQLTVTDLFLAIGMELGTLNPGPDSPWAGRLFAKTGTLRNAVTLAGTLYSTSQPIRFGLFYQTGSKRLARAERNRQLDEWFDTFGSGTPLEYQPQAFLPVVQESLLSTDISDFIDPSMSLLALD